MRTVRCSGRLEREGAVSAWRVVCLEGVCPWGCLPGGVCPGGVCPGGCLPRGGVHLPPVNRITDRCKNITFPQLCLRTVITTQTVNPVRRSSSRSRFGSRVNGICQWKPLIYKTLWFSLNINRIQLPRCGLRSLERGRLISPVRATRFLCWFSFPLFKVHRRIVGRENARPPSSIHFLSFSCSFWKKIGWIITFHTQHWSCPSPLGNPESATEASLHWRIYGV